MRATKRIALMLSLLLFLLSGCAAQSAETERKEAELASAAVRERKTNYDVQVMELTPFEHTATLTLEPSYKLIRAVKSGSTELDMVQILVSRNSVVKAGDTIAVLKGRGSLSDVAQKELEISAQRAGMEEQLELYRSRIEAEEEKPAYTAAAKQLRELRIQSVETERELYRLSAERQLAYQEEALEALRAAVSEVEIKAPISGKIRSITSRYKEGDVVPAGTELCSIYGEGSLLLVGTSGSGHFVYGKTVTVNIGKGEKQQTFTGKVVSSPELLPEITYGGQIFIRLDGELTDNKAAQCSAEVTKRLMDGAMVLPRSAVNSEDGKCFVQILDGESPKTRCVVRGPIVGSQTVILQGLNQGDSVVLRYYNG